MRPLIFGPEERAKLAALRGHAESNPFSLERLKAIAAAGCATTDEDPGFSCEIPVGFRIAFTIEVHPGGTARHISISVATRGRLPSPAAIQMIGRELGMRMNLFDPSTMTYFEGPDPTISRAVSIIEPFERGEAGGPDGGV
jgi:hypothetical protein